MFALLRRYQPGNPLLAVLYWFAIAAAILVGLFVAFTWAERFLPGGGQF